MEFEIMKIQIVETSIEHIDLNPQTNPGKEYELLKVFKKV